MIKILIADDHAIVRHGLRQVLQFDASMEIVGEAKNGNEVLEFVRTTPVDVVVLDITMPGRDGLDTLKELKRLYPRLQVIVLSMHLKDQYAIRVMKAGAASYISKDTASEELVDAINKAYRGEKYISPDVADLLAEYVVRGNDEPHKKLSDREFEVFCLLGSGKGLTQISQELSLSVKTISTYRTRIIEKTGFLSNAEMARYMMERGLT